MKKYLFLLAASLIAFSACYDDELSELDKEIAEMKATEVASLQEQVKNVSSSLDDLNELNVEITKYIDELKGSNKSLKSQLADVSGQLTNIKSSVQDSLDRTKKDLLSQLEVAKTTLEGQINGIDEAIKLLNQKNGDILSAIGSLKSYADDKFAEKTWVEGTYATIKSQDSLYDDVAAIREMIATLEGNLEQVTGEIKSLLEEKVNALAQKLGGDLAKEVETLSASISQAFENARKEISEAYTKAIAKAIEDSEKGIRAWVGTELTRYCTVSDSDAKVEALKAILGAVPDGATLQGEIDSLHLDLLNAKEQVTEAYKTFIGKAITESEGRISEAIDSSILVLVNDVINPLSSRVDVLDSKITTLSGRIDQLTDRINTIAGQVAAIDSSISALQLLQTALKGYIEDLRVELSGADTKNYEELSKKISALSGLYDTLKFNVDDLKAYVGSLPEGQISVTDWVTTSLATLDNQFSNYYTISQINQMVNNINSQISSTLNGHASEITKLGTRITNEISKLKTDIESWVTSQFTGYAKSSEVTSAIAGLKSDLETLFKTEDTRLSGRIDSLVNALNSAKTTIKTAYEQYITDAIKNGGFLNDTISNAIASLNANVDSLGKGVSTFKAAIDSLKGRMDAAEDSLALYSSRIFSIDSLLSRFIKGYEGSSFASEVQKMTDRIDACENNIRVNSDSLAKLSSYVYGQLSDDIDSLLNIQSGLIKAQEGIDSLKAFIGEHKEGETLSGLIDALQAQLDTCLKKAELTEIKKDITELLALSDKVMKLEKDIDQAKGEMGLISGFIDSLYKKGTLESIISDIENRINNLGHLADSTRDTLQTSLDDLLSIVDSLNKQIDYLTDAVLAQSISSITYIPVNQDGYAMFNKVASTNTYSVSFDFIINPAGLANILSVNSGCEMRYVSTPNTRAGAMVGTKFGDQKKEVLPGGILRVTVTTKDITPFKSGISAALFVNIKATSTTKPVSFTSKFIPVKVPSDVEYVSLDPSELTFKWTGETKTVAVKPENNSYSVSYVPEWISTSNKTNRNISFTAGRNDFNYTRSGFVVLKINGEDRYLKVNQEPRPEQTFTKFSPASPISLSSLFDYESITVTTSDGLSDWYIDFDNTSSGISVRKSGNTIQLISFMQSIVGDGSNQGKIRIVSYSGNYYYDYIINFN